MVCVAFEPLQGLKTNTLGTEGPRHNTINDALSMDKNYKLSLGSWVHGNKWVPRSPADDHFGVAVTRIFTVIVKNGIQNRLYTNCLVISHARVMRRISKMKKYAILLVPIVLDSCKL